MKLIIGNKAYSSWSMRGWLACKQSGLSFEELTVPLYGEDWDELREGENFAPSGGKVPILWDGESVIWDSLAIIDWLADKTHRDRFWPKDETARGMARSMAAEMHSSFLPLRKNCPMNTRKQLSKACKFAPEVIQDADRIITALGTGSGTFWQRRSVSVSAPLVRWTSCMHRLFRDFQNLWFLRFPGFAESYMETILEHDWMVQAWMESAEEEPWVIEKFDAPGAAKRLIPNMAKQRRS